MFTNFFFLDTFNQEIFKILLDKGLFGIILAVFSFYLAKLLEKFKAKNAFAHVLFDLQVKAYSEIFGILLKHNYLKSLTVNKLIEIRIEIKTPTELIQFENTDKYKAINGITYDERLEKIGGDFDTINGKFCDTFIELNDSVNKNMLFVSEDFITKITEYIDTLSEFKNTLLHFNSILNRESIDTVIENLSNKDVTIKLALVQNLILTEIEKKKK